jgi:hypothetical protein
MTLLPRGVKVYLAFGYIDMRKGIDGLAMLLGAPVRVPRPQGTARFIMHPFVRVRAVV